MNLDQDTLVRIAWVAEETGLSFGRLHTVHGLRQARILELVGHGRRAVDKAYLEALMAVDANPQRLIEAAVRANRPPPRDYELALIADALVYEWGQIDDVVPRFDTSGELVFVEVTTDEE